MELEDLFSQFKDVPHGIWSFLARFECRFSQRGAVEASCVCEPVGRRLQAFSVVAAFCECEGQGATFFEGEIFVPVGLEDRLRRLVVSTSRMGVPKIEA